MIQKIKKIVPFIRRDSHPELPLDPDVVQPGQYKWPPHFTPSLLLVVFLGGCVGAYARYWVSMQVPSAVNGWPSATFVVNLLGAFLLGFLLEGLVRIGDDHGVRKLIRLAIGTGFMGAFTTYSSFASDVYNLTRHDRIGIAIGYGLLTVVGGLALSAFGIWVASSHHKRRERRV